MALAMVGGAASSAPPPPALYPSDLPQRVRGYDLPPIYSVYHLWVGRGRKAALAKAVPYAPEWQGKHNWGAVVESELVHYDFGVLRIDRLERYCEGRWVDDQPAGACDYRYRYAFVPGSLSSNTERDRMILDSFRPDELTRLLAREDWKQPDPSGLWSDAELSRVFEEHTDLAALYRPYVELHEVSSSTCPALRDRLAELDKITLSIAPGASSFRGSEFPLHGQQTQIRLTAMTTAGGRVTIEGAQPLFAILEPVWQAVEGCSPPSYAKGSASKGGTPL